ncbi:hypothetical protein BSKO_04048 [Bryopsis sp. KO-2023]|nr:hypothetical protein BSKO_04048 [Bryopsis sp. KO-2023]
MELPAHFKVLYTKHVRQKRKVYQDGYLSISESRSANLYDEQGQLVTSGRMPQSLQVDSNSEALTLFEGLLVNCDEKCCLKDIPNVKRNHCGGETTVDLEGGWAEPAFNPCKKKTKLSLSDRWVAPQIPAVGKRRRFFVPVQMSRKESMGDGGEVPSCFQAQSRTSDAVVNSSTGLPGDDSTKHITPTGSRKSPGELSTQDDGRLLRSDEDILAMFLGTKQSDRSGKLAEGGSDGGKRSQRVENSHNPIPNENESPNCVTPVELSGGKEMSEKVTWNLETAIEVNRHAGDFTGPSLSRSKSQGVSMSDCDMTGITQSKSLRNVIKRRKFETPRARPSQGMPSAQADATSTGKAPTTDLNAVHDGGGSSKVSFGLKFPSAWENWTPCRRVDIPDCFWSLNRYRERWGEAIEEELNIKLGAIAKDFHAQIRECISRSNIKAQQQRCPKEVKNGAEFQEMARKKGVSYHAGCVLEVYQKKKPWVKFGEKDVEEGVEEADEKKERMFLKLKGMGKKGTYRKYDLWILSTSKDFSLPSPGTVGDRSQLPWTAIFCSLWHGPSNEGKIEVELISRKPSNLKRGAQTVHAIQGPQANLELAMKECLQDVGRVDGALMDSLLTGVCMIDANQDNHDPQQPLVQPPDAISRFRLNSDQAQAVWHAHSWLPSSNPDRKKPPVCLIHGPFGSGKSTLLVSIIHTLVSENEGKNSSGKGGGGDIKVLVSAHTNVAVDRVLLGLMESGFTDFIRVGSLPKIAKPVLKHSVHCSEGGGSKKSNAAVELRKMLKESWNSSRLVVHEVAEAEKGAERIRRKRLRSSSVVGVTCCSSLNPLLADLEFDVVILDEASQMMEPLSLMPIIRAKARFLIAAGDPCQLPPVIARPALLSCDITHGDKESRSKHGLFRPLFVRLASIGCTPILLRSQYRCHPELADLPNRAFYNGHLLSGISHEDRPPLVENWKPMMAVDVRGCANGINGSISNRLEAEAVARIVKFLLDSISEPCSVGVICFFKRQASLIETLVGQLHTKDEEGEHCCADSVQVATVDSFQGMEKDIIILSTSITQPGPFCSDGQRLNVALTRGKNHMVLVGCLPALQRTSGVLNEFISNSHRMNLDCSPVGAQAKQ